MAKNMKKEKNLTKPIGKHNYVDITDNEGTKIDGNVTIPGIDQVINAKKYVDTNKK